MPYSKLTKDGENFIKAIASYYDNNNLSMLNGNNGSLPYSDKENDATIIWKANVIDEFGNLIKTNDKFASYLIRLYNKYSSIYQLDANVIAAQAYEESRYKTWAYVKSTANSVDSTASGIAQINIKTLYDLIYNRHFLDDSEVAILVNGMEFSDQKFAWRKVQKSNEINSSYIPLQKTNRRILFQNMIDNPHIIIKAQAALMNFIANRNANLASSALFAYSRGSYLESNNYIQIVNQVSMNKNYNKSYVDDGLKYVQHIFGYLGDKDNQFVTSLDNNTKGYWFGYKIDFSFDEYFADSQSNYVQDKSTNDPYALTPILRIAFFNAQTTFNAKYKNQYYVVPNSIYRTPEKQYDLYKIGRDAHGNIIGPTKTPLDGYNNLSDHNKYKTKAFDFAIYTFDSRYVDGQLNNTNRALYEEFANLVINGNSAIVWGGNFKNQPNDVVHIQLNN